MLRAKPFEATHEHTRPVQEAMPASATQSKSATTGSDPVVSINMTGLAVTVACLLIAFGLAYGSYAHNAQLQNALFVMTSFLPLRVLLWIVIRH